MASDCVEGVIDWYGPTDLASWDAGRHPPSPARRRRLGAYLGCEPADCAPGLVHAASPLSYIGAMTPPFLIQHGSADTHVPPDQSQKLNEALQALHVPSEIVVYAGVGPDFTKDGAVDAATNAKVLADMEDFIAGTFPPAKPGANSPNGPVKAANSPRPRPTKPSTKSSTRK